MRVIPSRASGFDIQVVSGNILQNQNRHHGIFICNLSGTYNFVENTHTIFTAQPLSIKKPLVHR
jgi:hypothetical protein